MTLKLLDHYIKKVVHLIYESIDLLVFFIVFKILEKAVHSQLVKYLDQHKIKSSFNKLLEAIFLQTCYKHMKPDKYYETLQIDTVSSKIWHTIYTRYRVQGI